jgi:TRAP-type mannitol/chloroaromatic compound transport system permease small subunit
MKNLVRIADRIRRALELIAFAGGWLLIVLMAVTCYDVIGRKLGLELPSTRLQELEWHIHTAIFALWMGYNYTINAHPRVDSYTETLTLRRKAWIELVGCLLLAFPYMAVLCWYSLEFVKFAYDINEQSESGVGLAHRWIIKTVYAVGLWLVLIAIVSVMLRLVAFLFGGVRAEEARLEIGSSHVEV